ncbi:glycoside hydrolase family 2 TIM barrel-domain containing protein [Cohnella sp. 56]|uniref:glycoside hydrolase family 2 TIM barrel-domain containing protein n=1 Tax=Cohnella sp. 56 TaxID=3113722 RepID=UPI0030EA77F7
MYHGNASNAWYKGFEDQSWRTVTVSHDWSVEEAFSREHSSGTGYLPGGVGRYRRKLEIPEAAQGKQVYITFDGVYNHARVWCNSYYLGERPYGYSAFTYDITDFVTPGSDNIIAVKVNHADVADSRWFTGSGIYREVTLTVTESLHIDRYGVFATTLQASGDRAEVNAKVRLLNHTVEAATVQVRQTLLDARGELVGAVAENITLTGQDAAELDQTLSVDRFRLWSPGDPCLYKLRTEVFRESGLLDSVETTVGIRTFAFDAHKGFFLNGEPMKIKGICLHHDAGALGAAVTEQGWLRRLVALKEMGCNAIRMSHNPPSSNLLDLCDRLGFLVMDEAFDEWEGVKNKWSTGHNVYPPKHFGYYEHFPQWAETDLKEMVLRDRNHPSIVLWSIGNEIDYPNDPYCHPYFETMTGNNDANKPEAERKYDPNKPNAERLTTIAKRLVKYVKECDTTRPVTAALAFPELSNLIGLADTLDVVGYNYKEHLYERDCGQYPGRVIYGSENSSSLEAWRAVRDHEEICAQFIWTGIDYLGEAKGWPVRAASSGFLDLAGFKKPSYYYRQSLWSDKPMAYLAVESRDHPAIDSKRKRQDAHPHWNWDRGQPLEVFCYTNCPQAELFLNERSLGVKRLQDSPQEYISWEVSFEEGTLKVVTQDSEGNLHSQELRTARQPHRCVLNLERMEAEGNGRDLIHIEVQVTDEAGNLVYLANPAITVKVEGPGELVGIENGDVQDLEPYRSGTRKAHRGKLLAYVRTNGVAGRIMVTAEAPELEAAVGVIETR